MGLLRRTPAARVVVTPEAVRRRQTVTATVTTDNPIDKVSAATLEWGYTNFYRYRWAGRADSMATEMNDVWWLMGEVGTDAGSEKDTERLGRRDDDRNSGHRRPIQRFLIVVHRPVVGAGIVGRSRTMVGQTCDRPRRSRRGEPRRIHRPHRPHRRRAPR